MKQTWFLTRRGSALLRAAVKVSVVSYALLLLVAFAPRYSYSLRPSIWIDAVFVACALSVAVLMAGKCIVWIGMLHFLLVKDNNGFLWKLFWGFQIFFLFDLGGLIYYFVAFRPLYLKPQLKKWATA